MPKTKIKVSDIDKVSKKLDAFMEKLPAQEQEVLGWILARAQAAGGTEFKPISPPHRTRAALGSAVTAAARPAVSSTLARAAGLRAKADPPGGEIGVNWKHTYGRLSPDKLETVSKVAKVAKPVKTPRR